MPVYSSNGRDVLYYEHQMPKAPEEIRNALQKFEVEEKRDIFFMALFHTHPNFSDGKSRSNEPSYAWGDTDVQKKFFGHFPLGIIRSGEGYRFFIGISPQFFSDDARANKCIWELVK